MNDPIRFTSRSTWLDGRKGSLGASEVPILLGAQEHGSMWELWAIKRAEYLGQPIPAWEGSEDMEAGSHFERAALQLYAKRTEREVVEHVGDSALWRHPSLAMHASPDAIQRRDDGLAVLEVKWQRMRRRGVYDWAEGPPLGYAVQAAVQSMCVGLPATVAAVVGGFDLYHYDLAVPAELLARIEERVDDFWGRVRKGIEPPAEARDIPALKEWHRDTWGQGVIVDLSDELADLPDRLQAALNARKAAEAQVEELQARAMQALAHGDTLIVGGRKVATWREQTQPIMQKVGERQGRVFRWGIRAKLETPDNGDE